MNDQASQALGVPAPNATTTPLFYSPDMENIRTPHRVLTQTGAFRTQDELRRVITRNTSPLLSYVCAIDPVSIMRAKGGLLGLYKGLSDYATEEGHIVLSPDFNHGTTTAPRGRRYDTTIKFFDKKEYEYNLNDCWTMALCEVKPAILEIRRRRALPTTSTTITAEETTCPICLDDWTGRERNTCVNNHQVCNECYKKMPVKSCPLCRGLFPPEDHQVIKKDYRFDVKGNSIYLNAMLQEAQFVYFFCEASRTYYGNESIMNRLIGDTLLYWSNTNMERGSYEGRILNYHNNYSYLAIDASGNALDNPCLLNLYNYFISEENRIRLANTDIWLDEHFYTEQKFLENLIDFSGNDNGMALLRMYSDHRKKYLRKYIFMYYNISQMDYDDFLAHIGKIHKKIFDRGTIQIIYTTE